MRKANLRRVTEWAFFIVLFICAATVLFMLVTFRLDIGQRQTAEGYVEVSDYQREIVIDDALPVGEKAVYTFTTGQLPDSDVCLVFFSLHQTITVNLDGEEIYSIKPDADNAFGRTTGCVWNTVMLSGKDSGKQFVIEIVPVYASSKAFIPDFLLGSRYAIYKGKILQGIMSIICGFLAVLIGLFYITYIIYNRRDTEVDRSLLALGMFSVLLGCWKIVDTNAFHLLIQGKVAFSYSNYLLLTLVTVPYCMFIRQMLSSADKVIWYIPCIFSLAVVCVILAAQFLKIADMRQLLRLVHVSILLVAAVCIVMVVREILTVGWNPKIKKNVVCVFLCFIGMVLDLVIYYLTHGKVQSFLGIFNFLIYNLVVGISTIREAKELMKIGMNAKKFEKMAYHDQLTGLYNRAAYAELTESKDFDPEGYIVVVFDLNDLKKCNDTMGHEMGDKYIRDSAKIISDCFGDDGQCYRMGGDEFCVLLKGRSVEECKGRIKHMRERTEQYNRESKDFVIGIACGYGLFDKRLDYDISSTSRRADRMMYHEKYSMKQKAGA